MFRAVVVVPEFRGNKHLFSLNLPLLEHLLHGFAYLFFISVSFCGIELTKSCFERGRSRLFGVDGVGNQRAKTECGNHTGSIREGHLRIAKAVEFCGRFHMPPAYSGILVFSTRAPCEIATEAV